jgi:uncharacterized protein
MTTPLPSRRSVLWALGCAVMGACEASPTPRIFTLVPQPATPPPRPFAGTISVEHVALPKYLDRPEIVRYSNAYELTAAEFNRWGEGLGDMTTRVLVENLAERLPGSRVFAASGPLALSHVDVTLEISIDKFDADPGGAVLLVAQWVAHQAKRADRFHSEQIRVAMASNDVSAQVAAMSEALGQLSSRIAAGLSA